jgi:hypothetical protein
MIAMLGQFALTMHRNGAPEHNILLLPCVNLDRANFLREEQDCEAASIATPPPGCPKSKMGVSEGYHSFKRNVKKEEKKAFFARLVAAWSLFLVFWLACALFSDWSPCA